MRKKAQATRSGNTGPAFIHGLPNELLIKILLLVLRLQAVEEDDFPLLHTLAQVCSRWARVVKNTPLFWNKIYSSAPLDITQLKLGKCAPGQPLTVVCKAPYSQHKDIEPFMDYLEANSAGRPLATIFADTEVSKSAWLGQKMDPTTNLGQVWQLLKCTLRLKQGKLSVGRSI